MAAANTTVGAVQAEAEAEVLTVMTVASAAPAANAATAQTAAEEAANANAAQTLNAAAYYKWAE